MQVSNLMPWDMPEYPLGEVERAMFKVFSTTEGHILWAYLHKNILTSVVHDTDSVDADRAMIAHNGKRALVLHLRQMADRHYNSLQQTSMKG